MKGSLNYRDLDVGRRWCWNWLGLATKTLFWTLYSMVVFGLWKNYLKKESRESGVKNSEIVDNRDIERTDDKVTINKVYQLKL